MDHLSLVGAALAGTLLSAILSCIPALHIYHVVALTVVLAGNAARSVPGEMLALFMLGLVVGY